MNKLFILSIALYVSSFIPSCEPITVEPTPEPNTKTFSVAPADDAVIGTDYEIDPAWSRIRLEFNVVENRLETSNEAGSFCAYDYAIGNCQYQTGREKILTYYFNPPGAFNSYGRFIIWLQYGTVKHVAVHNFTLEPITAEWDQGMEINLDGAGDYEITDYIEEYETLYFDVYYVDELNDDFKAGSELAGSVQ